MKAFLKWVLFIIFLLLPLFLFKFVDFLEYQMRWKMGSPTFPGYNWFRWSHAYLVIGSVFCLGLYIPIVIAIIKRRAKLIIMPAALSVLFIGGSILLAFVGRNTYYAQMADRNAKAVKENPNDSLALERLADSYSQRGEYKKAIETFTGALTITPNPAYVIHDRGLAYLGNGQYNLAIEDFTKAMELQSSEKSFVAQSYNDRGVAYFRQGQYQESWKDVNKALDLGYNVHPGFLTALENKGFKRASQ